MVSGHLTHDQQRAAALFGIYYDREWRERNLPNPLRLERVRILPLDAALERLAEDPAHAARPVVRLAIAEVIGTHSVREERAELRRLVAPMAARLALERDLDRIIEESLKGRDRVERFLAAYAAMIRCQLRNFASSATFKHGVNEVTVEVEVKKTVNHFRGGAIDPRHWAQTLPLFWETTYLAANPDATKERYEDPPAISPSNPGKWNGYLFEVAVWPWTLFEFGRWRNIIRVMYDEQSPNIGFQFEEHECLDGVFFGAAFDGGIDCDSGEAGCTDAGDGWTKIAATKRLRFTAPEGLEGTINQIAQLWLLPWLEALVLLAACPP